MNTDRSLPLYRISPSLKRVIVALWFLSVATVIYGSLIPLPVAPPGIPYADKLFHFLAYCWLAALPMLLRHGRRIKIVLPVSLMILGILLEIGQLYVPGRSYSYGDMLANGMGVLAGSVCGGFVKPWIPGK